MMYYQPSTQPTIDAPPIALRFTNDTRVPHFHIFLVSASQYKFFQTSDSVEIDSSLEMQGLLELELNYSAHTVDR